MAELALRMVASLAVVVGLLLVIARISSKRFSGRAGNAVTVLHRQALSRSSSVAVVSVGSRVLVLGTTEQHVQILTELDPTDLDTAPDAPAADFASTLRASLGATPAVSALAAPTQAGPAPVDQLLQVEPVLPVLPVEPAAAPSGGRRRADASGTRTGGARRAGTHTAATTTPVEAPAPPRHAAPRHAAAPAATPGPVPAPLTPPLTDALTDALTDPLTDPLPVAQPVAQPVARKAAAHKPGGHKAAGHKAVGHRAVGHRAAPAAQDGPLAGSVLSPQTWRQAIHAVSRSAS